MRYWKHIVAGMLLAAPSVMAQDRAAASPRQRAVERVIGADRGSKVEVRTRSAVPGQPVRGGRVQPRVIRGPGDRTSDGALGEFGRDVHRHDVDLGDGPSESRTGPHRGKSLSQSGRRSGGPSGGLQWPQPIDDDRVGAGPHELRLERKHAERDRRHAEKLSWVRGNAYGLRYRVPGAMRDRGAGPGDVRFDDDVRDGGSVREREDGFDLGDVVRTPPIIDDGAASPLPDSPGKVLDEVLRRLPGIRGERSESADAETLEAIRLIIESMERDSN